MKQPRSSSCATNKHIIKKPLLPSFRQAKLFTKVQQISATNKSQLLFNMKLIPLEIVAERKLGEPLKILISSTDVIVIETNKNYRGALGISSNFDSGREWIEVNFGEIFGLVKIKKIGDQNTYTHNLHMVCWDKLEECDKRKLTTINVKEIIKNHQKKIESFSTGTLGHKDDKNKQMKAFVANLMLRKQGRRMTEKTQIQPKLHIKKNTAVFKNKFPFKEDQDHDQMHTKTSTAPRTAASILSELSGFKGIRSFRKEIIDISKLKDSHFTGKSQKQTSAGDQPFDQNSFISHNFHSKTSQINKIGQDNESRRRSKFDSQPYFYQNSNEPMSQLSNRNCSMNKFPNQSRQQSVANQQSKTIQLPLNPTQDAVDCLKNKSECQSEQQVEQDIKRQQALEQSIANGTFDQEDKVNRSKKAAEQSSECFESRQLGQSSGTIYQSRYQ